MILLVAPTAYVGTYVDVRRERKGMKRNSNSPRLALIRWVILATESEVMARAKIGSLGLQASCLLLSVVRDFFEETREPDTSQSGEHQGLVETKPGSPPFRTLHPRKALIIPIPA